MSKDPIITAKIHFIKSILKKHGIAAKENKKSAILNYKLYIENYKYGPNFYYWTAELKEKLTHYIDSGYNNDTITYVHIYYLLLKEVNKQHTKDDKLHVTKYSYQTTIQKLEKEFLVSQEVRKEGNHV